MPAAPPVDVSDEAAASPPPTGTPPPAPPPSGPTPAPVAQGPPPVDVSNETSMVDVSDEQSTPEVLQQQSQEYLAKAAAGDLNAHTAQLQAAETTARQGLTPHERLGQGASEAAASLGQKAEQKLELAFGGLGYLWSHMPEAWQLLKDAAPKAAFDLYTKATTPPTPPKTPPRNPDPFMFAKTGDPQYAPLSPGESVPETPTTGVSAAVLETPASGLKVVGDVAAIAGKGAQLSQPYPSHGLGTAAQEIVKNMPFGEFLAPEVGKKVSEWLSEPASETEKKQYDKDVSDVATVADQIQNKSMRWANKYSDYMGIDPHSVAAQIADNAVWFALPGLGFEAELPAAIDSLVTRSAKYTLGKLGYAGAKTLPLAVDATAGAVIYKTAAKFGLSGPMVDALIGAATGGDIVSKFGLSRAAANRMMKLVSGMDRDAFMKQMQALSASGADSVVDFLQRPIAEELNTARQEVVNLTEAGKDTAKAAEKVADLEDKLKLVQNQRGWVRHLEDISRFHANVAANTGLGAGAGAAFGYGVSPTGQEAQGIEGGMLFGGALGGAFAPIAAYHGMHANRIAYGTRAFAEIGSRGFDLDSIKSLKPADQQDILALNGAAKTMFPDRGVKVLWGQDFLAAHNEDIAKRAAHQQAKAGQPVPQVATPVNGFVDTGGNLILNGESLRAGVGEHEITHSTQEFFGKLLNDKDPESMANFWLAYEEARGKSLEIGQMTPEQISRERDAEVGRLLLKRQPLGAFYGGKRTGDVLAHWARGFIGKLVPDKIKVDPLLQAPYTSHDIEQMRQRYFELGTLAQKRRFLVEPTEGGGPAAAAAAAAPPGGGGGGAGPRAGVAGGAGGQPPTALTPGEQQVLTNVLAGSQQLKLGAGVNEVGNAIVAAKQAGVEVNDSNIMNMILNQINGRDPFHGIQVPKTAPQPPVTPSGVTVKPPQPPETAPAVTHPDYDTIRSQAEDAMRQKLATSKAKDVEQRIGRAGIEAAAQAHAQAVGPDSDLITWRTDKYGKSWIGGTRADPADPFHQMLIARAKENPAFTGEAVRNLNDLEANMGRAIAIDYSHAPEEGAAVTRGERAAARAEATAPERVAGEVAREKLTKSYVPTSITYSPKSNVFIVDGFSPDKLLNNASTVIDWAKGQGMKTFSDVNDPLLAQYIQWMTDNHKNGYAGNGKPIKGTALTPVEQTPGYKPHVIPKDYLDQVNVMLGNDTARTGMKGLSPEQAEKQLLAKQNSPYFDPATGEVNKLRAKMGEAASGLEPVYERLRPELIDRVRQAPVSDQEVLRPTGFAGDRGQFALRGLPRQEFTAAGLMPGTEIPRMMPAQQDKAIAANADKGATKVVESSENREVMGLDFNMDKIITLLGAKMYEKPLLDVSTKELLQNAFDTSREAGATPENPKRIDVDLDSSRRTITVTDSGLGMDKDIIKKAFLTIGGSRKTGDPANTSGGLGIAKMAFILGGDGLRLETVKNGMLHVMDVSRDDIANKRFPIESTRTDRPNGTKVTVQIPENYTDSNGETHEIWFHEYPDFLNQPLLGPVEVYKNGQLQDIGVHTDPAGLQKENVFNFGWGHIDVYVDPRKQSEYPSMKVLSAGLHQFDLNRWDVYGHDAPKVKYNMVFDVRPKVRAGELAYPFNNQREGWSNAIKKDTQAMYTYLQNMGLEQQLLEAKDVFSKLKVLPEFDPTKDLTQEQIDSINAAYGAQRQAPTLKGRRVTSVDFTPNDVVFHYETGRSTKQKREDYVPKSFEAKRKIDLAATLADVSQLDPQKPYLHNNTNVDFSQVEGEPELSAKLGNALIKFMREWGERVGGSYEDLAKTDPSGWFGGISYDTGYRGLNTVAPFKGIWFNPAALSEASMTSPRAAAFETAHIFLHEITHVKAREEGAGFTSELATNHARLRADEVPLEKFEAALTNIYADHWDTIHEIRDLFQNRNTENTAGSFKSSAAVRPEPRGGGAAGEGGAGGYAPQAGELPEQGRGGAGRTGEGDPRAGPVGQILAGRAAAEGTQPRLMPRTGQPEEQKQFRVTRVMGGGDTPYSLLHPEGGSMGRFATREEAQAEADRLNAERTKPRLMPGTQTETPEFKKWFGESKVTDKEGKPLVVYHGTIPERFGFNVFDRTASGRTGIDSIGSWFTTKEQAAGYGPHAYETYLKIENPYVVSFPWGIDPKEAQRWRNMSNDELVAQAEAKADKPRMEEIGLRVRDTGTKNLNPKDLNFYKNYQKNFVAEYNKLDKYKQEITDLDPLRKFMREAQEASGAKTIYETKGEAMRQKLIDQGYDGVILRDTIGDSGSTRPPADMFIAFEPTQIKSATENVGTFDPNKPDIRMMPGTAPLSAEAQEAFDAAKATPDEFGVVDVSHLSPADRRALAQAGLSLRTTRDPNQIVASYPRELRTEDLRQRVLGQRALAQADAIAEEAHRGVLRVNGEPYKNHVDRVADAVTDPTHKIIAKLHDTVEDAGVSLDQIRQQFGDRVSTAVDAVTRRDGEAYPDFIQRVADNPDAVKVKLADLRDNLSDAAEHKPSLVPRYEKAIQTLEPIDKMFDTVADPERELDLSRDENFHAVNAVVPVKGSRDQYAVTDSSGKKYTGPIDEPRARMMPATVASLTMPEAKKVLSPEELKAWRAILERKQEDTFWSTKDAIEVGNVATKRMDKYYVPTDLLGTRNDPKTIKGEKWSNFRTYIMYMAAHQASGVMNFCLHAVPSCIRGCLGLDGKGGTLQVRLARANKAKYFFFENNRFINQLINQIGEEKVNAKDAGRDFAVRLNGTTDVRWEKTGVLHAHPDVQYYDYTKYPESQRRDRPKNYNLTYSFTGDPKSEARSREWDKVGVNTAVVFRGGMPAEFLGRPVIDGDVSDLRFLDPNSLKDGEGVIVGLHAKGKLLAKDPKTGKYVERDEFVYDTPPDQVAIPYITPAQKGVWLKKLGEKGADDMVNQRKDDPDYAPKAGDLKYFRGNHFLDPEGTGKQTHFPEKSEGYKSGGVVKGLTAARIFQRNGSKQTTMKGIS